LKERTRALTWVAILGSVVGVALLAHPRAEADGVGRILGLISGLCAAGAYLAVRKAADSNPGITVVFYFTLLSSVVAIGCAVATNSSLPQTPGVWLCLVGAGVSATLAQLWMTQAYRLGPAALMSATSAASPLLTTLAGWWILGQVPDQAGCWGMGILVCTSVVLPLLNR
jgi:drug/metabolite transporter (DMT)-like permease